MSPALLRFTKYLIVGVSTFGIDLLCLYALTNIFHVQYVAAAGCSFLLGMSLNYYFSRKFVFKGSLRSVNVGYVNFLFIAGSGLLIVITGMYVFVTYGGFSYFSARIIIAGVTGVWNYLLNLYVNFKVVGVHE